MLIIGFGHKARQGKNTAAFAVLETMPLDWNARIFAFGDELRAEIRTAARQVGGGESRLIQAFKDAGIMPAWVEAESGKQRSLLQWWGTEYRRGQDPDYWIKKLFGKFQADPIDAALIADVRFPNEAAAIKAAGGYLVKCVRTVAPDVRVHEHPSEQALDGFTGWDYMINSGSIEDTRKQAVAIYRRIVGSLNVL